MEWIYRASQPQQQLPRRVAVLPGAFNPPTVAHTALAEAALTQVDEVVFVLPRQFPHKPYDGATLPQRAAMLTRLAQQHTRWSVALAEGGLYVEIGQECGALYGEASGQPVLVDLLCGRDAAERILTWDYGGQHTADSILEKFRLLVAPREGSFVLPLPTEWLSRIVLLPDIDSDDVSSTRIRHCLSRGESWQPFVPEAITPLVEEVQWRVDGVVET